MKTQSSRHGFTLVELLVVVAIIGILAAILLPAVQSARESARRAQCMSRLKQNSLAFSLYQSSYGVFPPGRMGCDGEPSTPDVPCNKLPRAGRLCGASSFVAILPFIEEQPLYDVLDPRNGGLWVDNLNDLRWYLDADQKKRDAVLSRPAVFGCPSSIANGITDIYSPTMAAVGDFATCNGTHGPDEADQQIVKYRNDGPFVYGSKRSIAQISAGLSKVYFIGEVTHSDSWESTNVWTYGRVHSDTLRSTRNPLNTRPGEGIIRNRRNGAFASEHPGGASFAWGDGHVSFVSDEIDTTAYQASSVIQP